MSDEELRMDAYYYGFGETFQIEIDRILSAVACAGKAFHHTEDWNCEATPRSEHEGATPIDWIQNRANEAADAMSRLRAEVEKLRAERDECERQLQNSFSKMGGILEERNVLRAALKPFAGYSARYTQCFEETSQILLIKVCDLRAAAAAYKETGDE